MISKKSYCCSFLVLKAEFKKKYFSFLLQYLYHSYRETHPEMWGQIRCHSGGMCQEGTWSSEWKPVCKKYMSKIIEIRIHTADTFFSEIYNSFFTTPERDSTTEVTLQLCYYVSLCSLPTPKICFHFYIWSRTLATRWGLNLK